MKILAIDDSNVNLLVMKNTIEKHLPDAVLETAHSGTKGLELARSWHPDTILLDLQMPEMDGYETIQRLKQDHATAYIPIIIITAADVASKDRVKALDLGADAFLQKPISPMNWWLISRSCCGLKRPKNGCAIHRNWRR
jgi:CheY-like chemotaxis protein